MKPHPARDLLVLAALWGASFLFMRVSVPEFGPLPMAALRVAGAAALLLPLLHLQGKLSSLRTHWRALLVVGITNSALPFVLFGYASLHVTAGLAAIFNAATPLFGATIAWLWLGEALGAWRIVGLAIGFIGVAGLAWMRTGGAGASGPPLAIAACLAAPLMYGLSASITRRHLSNAPPMAVAAGSQFSATLALAVPAALNWPSVTPGAAAWLHLAALAVLCTGLAYVLYFRLIAQSGPAYAMTVTYLLPAFAIGWGAIFLGEAVTWPMLMGCAVILLGTALATGMWPRR